MRALVGDRYGQPTEVLRITDVDRPTIARSDVLLRVVASSINPADWHHAGPTTSTGPVHGCELRKVLDQTVALDDTSEAILRSGQGLARNKYLIVL